MRILTLLSLLLLPILAQAAPTGLYAVDSAQGTYRDGSIRDYDFVTGYAWRYSWKDFETAEGVYDFAPLDHIIARMLEVDQKLSLIIMPATPDYLLNDPDIETWLDGEDVKPSPWSAELQARYRAFILTLAHHKILDSNGRMVPFKKHSALGVIHPSIPGLPRGALRDGQYTDVADVPGYSRDNLLDAVDFVLTYNQRAFPYTDKFVSLWPFEDGESPDIWEVARDKVLEFPNVGLWQDNLWANRPCVNCEPVTCGPTPDGLGQVLIGAPFVGFQMLGSWAQPFNSRHVPKTENATVVDGLDCGMINFGAEYYEVYPADLDYLEQL